MRDGSESTAGYLLIVPVRGAIDELDEHALTVTLRHILSY